MKRRIVLVSLAVAMVLGLVSMVALICTGSISARLVWLQVERHDYYTQQARKQRQNIRTLPPRRGDIHDRHGNELALSVAAEMIIARPHLVEDPAGTARLLAPILQRPAGNLEEMLRDERKYVRLLKKATPAQCNGIRALHEEGLLAGIGFESWRRRIYPHETLAAHALGFVRPDGNAGGGLESRFHKAIHGANGRAVQSRDANKTAFDMHILEAARPGHDLQLTLDMTVQHVLEEELAHAAALSHARAGAAVAMDPATGEILAMASWPTFNPNDYSRADEEARRDRVVVSAYEPGSTFKIITAAAALEAVGRFAGVKRRLELRGTFGGVELYDDFAHPPTAIARTLAGIRAGAPTARVLVALEPRSNTMRMGVHRDALGPALTGADQAWVLRPGNLDWDLDAALAGSGAIRVCDEVDEIVRDIAAAAQPGDRLVVMSNGGFEGIHERLAQSLSATG